MILVGGAVPDAGWRVTLWTAAFALQIASPYLHRMRRWAITPTHFVERHGLVVIVALGESVVAIGVGAAGVPVDAGLIAVAVLGLVMAYLLWWTYFGDDPDAAEHALAATPPPTRPCGRTRLRVRALSDPARHRRTRRRREEVDRASVRAEHLGYGEDPSERPLASLLVMPAAIPELVMYRAASSMSPSRG